MQQGAEWKFPFPGLIQHAMAPKTELEAQVFCLKLCLNASVLSNLFDFARSGLGGTTQGLNDDDHFWRDEKWAF